MEREIQPKKNSFARASMFLGVAALFSMATIFFPIPLAALSILFACLSHRKGLKRELSALVGLISSVVALIISTITIIASVAMLPTMIKDPQYREQLDAVAEQLYGDSFEDMIEELYGVDIDDLFEN